VLAVPALAVDAQQEVARVGRYTTRVLRSVLSGAPPSAQAADLAVVKGLDQAVEAFIERMNRAAMSEQASARLAELLRIERYHEACAELATSAAPVLPPAGASPALAQCHHDYLSACAALLPPDAAASAAPSSREQDAALTAMEVAYEALKASPARGRRRRPGLPGRDGIGAAPLQRAARRKPAGGQGRSAHGPAVTGPVPGPERPGGDIARSGLSTQQFDPPRGHALADLHQVQVSGAHARKQLGMLIANMPLELLGQLADQAVEAREIGMACLQPFDQATHRGTGQR
jgi:hypothetical protein